MNRLLATIDDYITTFSLKKKGLEWVGPCPSVACNGEGRDRFHVKDSNGQPVFGCRSCIDNGQDPSGANARSVLELVAPPVRIPTARRLNLHRPRRRGQGPRTRPSSLGRYRPAPTTPRTPTTSRTGG